MNENPDNLLNSRNIKPTAIREFVLNELNEKNPPINPAQN